MVAVSAVQSLVSESNIAKALSLDAETVNVDFKSSFNAGNKGEFLGIIKDVLAMANSGGGLILIGLTDNGQPSGMDLASAALLDPAKITDAIYKYTDCQFDAFEKRKLGKDGAEVWCFVIGATTYPIVFSQTGNYEESPGKQKNAFLGGAVYFRHGAKSEVGNSDDLRQFIERRVGLIRKEWLNGIARVVEAPPGSVIQVVSPGGVAAATEHGPGTYNPSAAALEVGSIDKFFPYRQKEVLAAVNKVLSTKINPSHLLAVRRAHDIEANGGFCYPQEHMSPKYSQAYVDWIVGQASADPAFFDKAKVIADERRSRAAGAK